MRRKITSGRTITSTSLFFFIWKKTLSKLPMGNVAYQYELGMNYGNMRRFASDVLAYSKRKFGKKKVNKWYITFIKHCYTDNQYFSFRRVSYQQLEGQVRCSVFVGWRGEPGTGTKMTVWSLGSSSCAAFMPLGHHALMFRACGVRWAAHVLERLHAVGGISCENPSPPLRILDSSEPLSLQRILPVSW